jgi:catechol 2,3-dioxygenase-like lactoylglutathione lyase family enzyme
MRLEHANITVENIDVSYQFYNAVFGFEKRWEGTATGEVGPIRALHVGNEHTYLALFEAERKGRIPADYGIAGVNHIGFEVENLETYRQRLEKLGVEVHLEADYEPGRRIYFCDRDGIEIELVEYQS